MPTSSKKKLQCIDKCYLQFMFKNSESVGSKEPTTFELPLDSTSYFIVDVVRHHWKMYQTEHITESIYMAENETRKNISNSYWNYVLEHSGLSQDKPMEESRNVRIVATGTA